MSCCGVRWCGLVVSSLSTLNPCCIALELGMGFDNFEHGDGGVTMIRMLAGFLVELCCGVVELHVEPPPWRVFGVGESLGRIFCLVL